ncbi:hypothetical protein BHM03_00001730 [Ensete ventricosum]|nr:hypothetical protein BHM03_00001730 [Ensete ventricosum]
MWKSLKLAGVVNRRGSGGGQFWQRRCVGEKLGLSSIDVTDVEVREESSVGTTWWGGGKGSSGKSFFLGVRSLPVRVRPQRLDAFAMFFGFFEALIDNSALRYFAIGLPPVRVRLWTFLGFFESLFRPTTVR